MVVDAPPSLARMTASDVLDAVERLHPREQGQWAFLREFRWGVGFTVEGRVDALAVSCWRLSKGWEGHKVDRRRLLTVAYEVKVDRGDFFRELHHPEKRAHARMFCDLFFFACPTLLVDKDEVPRDCGLIYVDERGAWVVRKAPIGIKVPPSYSVFAAMARRADRAEHELARVKESA